MPTEREAQLMEKIYRDQGWRDKVLAEIGKRPDIAVNRIMLLISEAWIQGGQYELNRANGQGESSDRWRH